MLSQLSSFSPADNPIVQRSTASMNNFRGIATDPSARSLTVRQAPDSRRAPSHLRPDPGVSTPPV